MTHVETCRWTEIEPGPERDRMLAEIDQVFFSSSARQSFGTMVEKAGFRERWLGRYLRHFSDLPRLALDRSGHVIGYIIGSLDDPARDPIFADLPFVTPFGPLSAHYPAHLHVNLDDAWRGRGIGRRLVAEFVAEARTRGAKGVHVVTERGMRNVGFYLANDFLERGATTIDGRELLFLGKDLSSGD